MPHINTLASDLQASLARERKLVQLIDSIRNPLKAAEKQFKDGNYEVAKLLVDRALIFIESFIIEGRE